MSRFAASHGFWKFLQAGGRHSLCRGRQAPDLKLNLAARPEADTRHHVAQRFSEFCAARWAEMRVKLAPVAHATGNGCVGLRPGNLVG